jgi:hypothetical protein
LKKSNDWSWQRTDFHLSKEIRIVTVRKDTKADYPKQKLAAVFVRKG